MKRRLFLSFGSIVVALAIAIGVAQARGLAALPAPTLLSPADGSTIVHPNFQWQAVLGADHYDVQVASDATFTTIVWEKDTRDTTITPIHTLPNGSLWWRVRSVEAGDIAGAWSYDCDFTKQIAAPLLTAPANGSTVITPTLQWQSVDGAAYYHVEVASDLAFTLMEWQEDTYDLNITPNNTLPNGGLFWRVRGLDADDHPGTYSVVYSFTKQIPAPTLTSPVHRSSIITPTFQWQTALGAAYYHIDVASDSGFTVMEWQENTFDLNVTPINALVNGVLYWRVRGMDIDDHPGTYSSVYSLTKYIPAPVLVSPANSAVITTPALSWQAAPGAAYYHVEIASDSGFTTIAWQDNTYDLSVTPNYTLSLTQFWWRVRGRDANDHDGTLSSTRTFTLTSPSACGNTSLTLIGPGNGSTIYTDPTFQWNCLQSATYYRVKVYQDTTLYDNVRAEYTQYTAFSNPSYYRETYPNGTYTWKIEAYTSTLMTTSEVRTFTKASSFDLIAPGDGAALTRDPVFQWQPLEGAAYYRVKVYRSAVLYDNVHVDYLTYTPFSNDTYYRETYPNDTYTWKVEAYNDDNDVIATSLSTRTFTKASVFNLLSPADSAALTRDPVFQWQPLEGAAYYRVKVYRNAVLYDNVHVDYLTYTPFSNDTYYRETYPNDTYTWKVEAYNVDNDVITTSLATRTFTKASAFDLLSPPNGAIVSSDPTFHWQPLEGAMFYRVLVYHDAVLYDNVRTEHLWYTPFSNASYYRETYPYDTYTWKIEAYDQNSNLITTSNSTLTFGVMRKVYLPLVLKNT